MTSGHGGKREGAGRKPGSVNALIQSYRDKVNTEEIIEFLNDVACGKEVVARSGLIPKKADEGEQDDFYEGPLIPTMAERMRASEILLKKTVPDLKAIEHSGKDGTELPVGIQVTLIRSDDASKN